jgi:hypothetical protein
VVQRINFRKQASILEAAHLTGGLERKQGG